MMIDEPNADSKFTIFNELPLEIRQMIWKATFRGRVVKVILKSFYHVGNFGSIRQRDKVVFHNSAPYPRTMFVNRESRNTTLLHYTKPCQPNPGNPRLFHPKLDSVMVTFSTEYDSKCLYNWDDLKRVACWHCPALKQTLRTLFLPCLDDVFGFRNLEHLIIFEEGKEVVPLDGQRRVDYEGVKLLFEKGFRRRNLKDKRHKIPKFILYLDQIDLPPGFQDKFNR